MQPFTERTIRTISSIPEGKVMSYGQISRCAGNPRAARRVARILHTMSEKYHLPWHRVVNAQGKITIKEGLNRDRQCELLKKEGVPVMNHQVPMKSYQVSCDYFHEEI